MKHITILGSTGSIGTQTLDVISNHKNNFQIDVLTTYKNIELLEMQCRKFKPKIAVVVDIKKANELKIRLADTSIKVLKGSKSLIEAAIYGNYDNQIIVIATVGISGLLPTIFAIKNKKKIALANKEVLVCAGELINKLLLENKKSEIIPLDSEHSAIFQCLAGNKHNKISKIILTASGGPFFNYNIDMLKKVKKEEVMKHPKWNMGTKITIDSASLINKAFEFIEAMWLFGTKNIEILIHPESIIHSMVEFNDHSIISQISYPDMRLPIQYALTYPNRLKSQIPSLNFVKIKKFTFFEPDITIFKALNFIINKSKNMGNSGAILNGANEALVDLFLRNKINFIQISDIICSIYDEIPFIKEISIENIIQTNKLVKEIIYEKYN